MALQSQPRSQSCLHNPSNLHTHSWADPAHRHPWPQAQRTQWWGWWCFVGVMLLVGGAAQCTTHAVIIQPVPLDRALPAAAGRAPSVRARNECPTAQVCALCTRHSAGHCCCCCWCWCSRVRRSRHHWHFSSCLLWWVRCRRVTALTHACHTRTSTGSRLCQHGRSVARFPIPNKAHLASSLVSTSRHCPDAHPLARRHVCP